jgi:hypothetical protein
VGCVVIEKVVGADVGDTVGCDVIEIVGNEVGCGVVGKGRGLVSGRDTVGLRPSRNSRD